MAQSRLHWQSKTVLLILLPFISVDVVLEAQEWAARMPAVATWTLSLSVLLGLVTWKLRAATPWAAATGAVITASLMFSTATPPYGPLHTALVPVLAVSVLAFAATHTGRPRKQRLGTGEGPQGRSAAQVAANLGMAAIVSSPFAHATLAGSRWFAFAAFPPTLLLTAGLAALAEAAADTVSSEIGQVFGDRPRMITTLRTVQPGSDGALSLSGTIAGVVAAALVAATGTLALRGGVSMFMVSGASGVFGLFLDSLLGATFEQRGWLNNDAVNFLSTAAAAAFALAMLAVLR